MDQSLFPDGAESAVIVVGEPGDSRRAEFTLYPEPEGDPFDYRGEARLEDFGDWNDSAPDAMWPSLDLIASVTSEALGHPVRVDNHICTPSGIIELWFKCAPWSADDRVTLAGAGAGDGTAPAPAHSPEGDESASSLRRIREASHRADRLRAEYSEARAEAKARKAAWESAVEDLQKIIRAETGPAPLFDYALGQQAGAVDGDADHPSGLDADDEQSWRGVPLRDALAGLSDKIFAAFDEQKLATMGDLSDYLAAGPLTDLYGIGPGKAEKIEAALEQFWADRQAQGVARPKKQEAAK